ncbi:MAG: hypothetical protein ACOX25_03480 [Caldicoprobacterales bacterium]|jgi:hypothetical protein
MTNQANDQVLPTFEAQGDKKRKEPCPQKPGTLIRIFIPAGAVINLLNLIEVSSPSGICLIIRIPLLGGLTGNDGSVLSLADIQDAVNKVGGTLEFME